MNADSERPLWNLGFALSQLGYRARQAFLAALAPWELRPAHYGTLVYLAALGPCSQRELASATGIDRGDLVGFLDTLEEHGLAARRRDPADRRRYAVALTAAGRDLLRELNDVAAGVNDAFFAPLDASERAHLESLLKKLWEASNDRM
jgi:MarR family transcriptional regulator, lower aerobic nicotinate degradation pathway regulator